MAPSFSFLNPLLRIGRASRIEQAESGRGNTGVTRGYIHPDDLNPDLVWPNGYRVFDQMWRSDPDVRKAILMVITPMIAGTWEVQPYGGDDADDKARKHADFVEWNLLEFMRPTLPSHLDQAMRMAARMGNCPFEQVFAPTTWQGKQVLALSQLAMRLPRTVYRFNSDGERLISITQFTIEKGSVELGSEHLVYYRFGAEGDNWEGESLLRSAYKPWTYKDRLELVDAISHERFAVGVPVVYPPTGASAADMTRAEQAASGIRANQAGHIVMPGPKAGQGAPEGAGWLLEILTPSGGGEQRPLHESLRYHKDGISAAVLIEFMRLGHANVGARATAETQQDPFLALVEAITSVVIEDTLNEQLIPRLVGFNFPDAEGLPRLRASLVDNSSVLELAQAVQALSAAGALHMDDPLEDFLRNRLDLPPADPEARAQRDEFQKASQKQLLEGGQPQAAPPGAPGRSPAPRPGLPAGSQPRALPAAQEPAQEPAQTLTAPIRQPYHDHMDLETTRALLDGARERFKAAADPFVRGIATAAVRGSTSPPRAQLEHAIVAALEEVYLHGRRSVVNELQAQGGGQRATTLAGDDDPGGLSERAKLAAEMIITLILNAIGRVGLHGGGTEQDAIDAGVQAGLGAAAGAATDHATDVLAQGRQHEAQLHDDDIQGAYYTSILDPNRCEQCAHADDGVLRQLSDPALIRPPNPDCYGGHRCRCMLFYVLAGETPHRLDAQDVPNEPGKTNWVQEAGGLPHYIARIAGDLITERGMDTSRAIATAVAQCKRWAAGGGDVSAETQAQAAGAIAEWEAKKGKRTLKAPLGIPGDWDPALHPRDDHGRFTIKGRGAGVSHLLAHLAGSHGLDTLTHARASKALEGMSTKKVGKGVQHEMNVSGEHGQALHEAIQSALKTATTTRQKTDLGLLRLEAKKVIAAHEHHTVGVPEPTHAPVLPAQHVAPPHPLDSIPSMLHLSDLEHVQGLGGSTGAQQMRDAHGNLYVVKSGASPDHIAEEDAANRVYRALGYNVPASRLEGGQQVARFVQGTTLADMPQGAARDQAVAHLREGFALDALLGNWDVNGLNNDNVLVAPQGDVYRIDNGGSLRFRAMGDLKPASTDHALELDSMRTQGSAKAVFGGMTDEEVAKQVHALLPLRPEIEAQLSPEQRAWMEPRWQAFANWATEHGTPTPEHLPISTTKDAAKAWPTGTPVTVKTKYGTMEGKVVGHSLSSLGPKVHVEASNGKTYTMHHSKVLTAPGSHSAPAVEPPKPTNHEKVQAAIKAHPMHTIVQPSSTGPPGLLGHQKQGIVSGHDEFGNVEVLYNGTQGMEKAMAIPHELEHKPGGATPHEPDISTLEGAQAKFPVGTVVSYTGKDGVTTFEGTVAGHVMREGKPAAKLTGTGGGFFTIHADRLTIQGAPAGPAPGGAPTPAPPAMTPLDQWKAQGIPHETGHGGGPVTEALQAHQAGYTQTVKGAQAKAVAAYTDGDYHELSALMRDPTKLGSAQQYEQIDHIREAIKGAPPTEHELIIHRGVKGTTAAAWKNAKPGQNLIDNGFSSTSSSESVSSGWGELILHIRAPKGTQGLWVSGGGGAKTLSSVGSGEKEFLLPPHSRFHVVERRTVGGKVHLDVVLKQL